MGQNYKGHWIAFNHVYLELRSMNLSYLLLLLPLPSVTVIVNVTYLYFSYYNKTLMVTIM